MNLFTDYTAIDIGTQCLKFFSVAPGASGQGYFVQTFSKEDLPTGLVSGGFVNPSIRSLQEFADIVRRQVDRLGLRREGVIVGLPDRWVKLNLVYALLKSEEIQSPEYLSWRLKKIVTPPGVGEVLVDHQILSSTETADGVESRVMVGLVQKSIIDILSQLMIDLRLEVHAFDTSSLGVFNLLETIHPDKTNDGQVILCHVGHETTVVKVFDQGALQYERVIEVGGEAFAKLFGEAETLAPPEAGKQIAGRTFFPVTREEVLQQIVHRHLFEKVFGNWLRELNVTFRFYQDKYKVMKLPPIFLTGGSCQFVGMSEFLSDFFDTPCQKFNPLLSLSANPGTDELMKKIGPQFAPAMGLLVI